MHGLLHISHYIVHRMFLLVMLWMMSGLIFLVPHLSSLLMMVLLSNVIRLSLLLSLLCVYLLALLIYYPLLITGNLPPLSHSLAPCMSQSLSSLDSSHLYYNFSIIGTLLLWLLPLALYTHPLNIVIGMMGMLLPLILGLVLLFILILFVFRVLSTYVIFVGSPS